MHKKWGWKKWKGCAFLCKAPCVCVDTETGSNSISITPIFMNECNTFIFRDISCYCLKKAGKRCRVLKDPNIHLGHLSRVVYQSKKSRIYYNILKHTQHSSGVLFKKVVNLSGQIVQDRPKTKIFLLQASGWNSDIVKSTKYV